MTKIFRAIQAALTLSEANSLPKKLGGAKGGPSKNLGEPWPSKAPLRIVTAKNSSPSRQGNSEKLQKRIWV